MRFRGWVPPEAEKKVVALLGKAGFWLARPGLDAAYQQQLVTLTRARRAAADVATWRKRLELQIDDLERQAGDARDGAAGPGRPTGDAAGQLAGLRRQYTEMQAKEDRITAASRRLMTEIDAFRTGQAATVAAYTAAQQAAAAVQAEMGRNPSGRG